MPVPSELSRLELYPDWINHGLSDTVTSSMTIFFYVKVSLIIDSITDVSRIAKFQVDVISCELESSDYVWSSTDEIVIQIGQLLPVEMTTFPTFTWNADHCLVTKYLTLTNEDGDVLVPESDWGFTFDVDDIGANYFKIETVHDVDSVWWAALNNGSSEATHTLTVTYTEEAIPAYECPTCTA